MIFGLWNIPYLGVCLNCLFAKLLWPILRQYNFPKYTGKCGEEWVLIDKVIFALL